MDTSTVERIYMRELVRGILAIKQDEREKRLPSPKGFIRLAVGFNPGPYLIAIP